MSSNKHTYADLCVPIVILSDQIEGFTLYPRECVNLPPVTSIDNIHSGIQGLKNTSPWEIPVRLSNKTKERGGKSEGIDVEPPKPKKNSSRHRFDDGTG